MASVHIVPRAAPSRVRPSPSARTALRPPSARFGPLHRGDSSSPIARGTHDRHAARPNNNYPSHHGLPVTSGAHGSPAFRPAPPYCAPQLTLTPACCNARESPAKRPPKPCEAWGKPLRTSCVGVKGPRCSLVGVFAYHELFFSRHLSCKVLHESAGEG